MGNIFRKELCHFVIPYLDDIIIFSKNTEEYKKHLAIVFNKIKAVGIKLNDQKTGYTQQR